MTNRDGKKVGLFGNRKKCTRIEMRKAVDLILPCALVPNTNLAEVSFGIVEARRDAPVTKRAPRPFISFFLQKNEDGLTNAHADLLEILSRTRT